MKKQKENLTYNNESTNNNSFFVKRDRLSGRFSSYFQNKLGEIALNKRIIRIFFSKIQTIILLIILDF